MTTRNRRPTPPAPPKHLRPDTAKWWRKVVSEIALEEHHYRLLRVCCEAYDECQESREELAKVGRVFKDRFGCPKVHPLVLVERDARLAFVKTLRELGLDLIAPDEARPPGVVGKSAVDDDEEDEV